MNVRIGKKEKEKKKVIAHILDFTHHMLEGLFCSHQKPPFIYGSDCDP